MTLAVILIVSGALIFGALWGLYGKLPPRTEAIMVATSGGALIVAAMIELIEPALKDSSVYLCMLFVFLGGLSFTVTNYLIDRKMEDSEGMGMLLAVTFDGIPENLALGVILIGADLPEVAALGGSIFLSNLPEAAGGSREMKKNMSKRSVLGIWAGTAAVLSLAALAGNFLLSGVDEDYLSFIKCFAGGAVVASLATEIFPKAYKKDNYWAGVATTIGVILAFLLNNLK